MRRINHAETRMILPMNRQDKAILMEMVHRLAPHRGELIENWRRAFAISSARLPGMTDHLVAELAEEMIDALIDLPAGGHFDQYFDAMRQFGQQYVRRGVPYASLVFAVHLYEETNLPVIAREYKSISDQGIGVARTDIPHLFEPFSRLYRERRVKGTGLGLYITRGIVQAHAGRVWVDSEEGKGSTFHFALPIKDGQRSRPAQAS